MSAVAEHVAQHRAGNPAGDTALDILPSGWSQIRRESVCEIRDRQGLQPDLAGPVSRCIGTPVYRTRG